MKPVSLNLYRRLNSDDFDPIELIDITLVGQDPSHAFHFTGAGEEILFNGNLYLPIFMSHGQVEERLASTTGEVPSVTMTVTNVDSQMARLLGSAELDGAEVTLWMGDRQLTKTGRPRDVVRVTIGELRDAALGDETFTFAIANVLGQKERITIPKRIYKSQCNYLFGSTACGVNITASPITIDTTVQAGTTASAIVVPASVLTTAGSPADPNDFWASAFIWPTDGVAGLQSRQVQRFATVGGIHIFYLRVPMWNSPAVGDPIRIRRQCRKIKTDCQAYQGNILQYGGFEEVPPVRFKPVTKDLTVNE